jgi:A/G-specific adenine glycosylase
MNRLPLRKPKREKEIWAWEPFVIENKGRLGFIKNPALPFLKNHWVLPGGARRLKDKPQSFDFKHNITHHEIYVTLRPKGRNMMSPEEKEILWLTLKEVQGRIPTSIIQKALGHWERSSFS